MDDTGTDENNSSDDEPHDDDDAPSTGAPPSTVDDGSRLDELDDRIQSARAEAEDAGVEGLAGEDGDKFTESGGDGSTQEDDQTIAPPG